MTKFLLVISGLFALSANAQFTPNNLAVLKISSGAALGNSGTSYAVNVVEYSTTGTATGVDISLTGGTPNFVLEERSITHEGQLNLSSNGMYLSAIGYNTTTGQTATTIRGVEKRIARINAAGTLDLSTNFPTAFAYNGVSVRGTVSAAGSNYTAFSAVTSGAHGARTINHGTNAITLFNSTGYRSLELYGGVVYGSTISPSSIFSHDAGGVATELPFTLPAGTRDYTQFVFFDMETAVNWNSTGFDLLYVADRNAGIRKFYFDGANWTPVGLVGTATGLYNTSFAGTTGFHGLTGRLEDGKPVLYGVKILGAYTSSHLAKIVDNSSRATDWNTAGNFPTATQLAVTDNTEQFKGIAFTPGTVPLVVLPITLTSFNGSLINNNALLRWQATTGVDAKEFVIERSKDGIAFTTAGTVTVDIRTNNYSFEDKNLFAGTNYYRLKLVNANGSFKYSKFIVLRLDANTGKKLNVFPNPVSSFLSVSYPPADIETTLVIADMTGKEVFRKKIPGGSSQESFDVSSLSAGGYVLTLYTTTGTLVSKFIK